MERMPSRFIAHALILRKTVRLRRALTATYAFCQESSMYLKSYQFLKISFGFRYEIAQ
jgi:hypothetical protein